MILVTGGAGYIGSHACVELLNAGAEVVVFDNFCNSSPASLDRVQKICGKSLTVVEGDVREQTAIESVLTKYDCTAVLHFAGLKSVQDSVAQPLKYYDYNVIGSQRLLCAMQNTGVNQLIFSSSATVCAQCSSMRAALALLLIQDVPA
jgi:UDP-glucose 4-epimerase